MKIIILRLQYVTFQPRIIFKVIHDKQDHIIYFLEDHDSMIRKSTIMIIQISSLVYIKNTKLLLLLCV